MERYLCTSSHEAIISDEMFMAVQQEKLSRTQNPETRFLQKLLLKLKNTALVSYLFLGIIIMSKAFVWTGTLCLWQDRSPAAGRLKSHRGTVVPPQPPFAGQLDFAAGG